MRKAATELSRNVIHVKTQILVCGCLGIHLPNSSIGFPRAGLEVHCQNRLKNAKKITKVEPPFQREGGRIEILTCGSIPACWQDSDPVVAVEPFDPLWRKPFQMHCCSAGSGFQSATFRLWHVHSTLVVGVFKKTRASKREFQ